MIKVVFALAVSLAASLTVSAEQIQLNPYNSEPVIIEHNVMVPMRDGVRLATDIFRPAGGGKYPVILTRDPYDNGSDDASVAEGIQWAKRGYVFLHQDVRGRYDSQGEFRPYFSELTDGYDAQQWAGQQAWSSGKVGMLGGSYMATVQWQSAHLRSPALVAMAPRMTPYNYYKDVAYVGGALSLASRIDWAVLMNGRTNQLRSTFEWDRVTRHLPLMTMDLAAGQEIAHWREWIAHPSYDDYWKAIDVEARAQEIDVPTYSIGGWYDVFTRANLQSYVDMRKKGYSERARNGQKLIVGPWPHTGEPARKLGDLDFGADSVVNFDDLHVRWFGHWLKGAANGVMGEAPVRIFVMGENRWRDEQEWPLARTRYTKFYFHSKGRANGRAGDGRLDKATPSGSSTDRYVYDPQNPVPTIGGNLMYKALPPGPYDQSKLDGRNDILMYATAPLEQDLEVTGPVTVTLYAASDARDTDFTAKLVDIHPDGKAYNIADGIIRARYRNSFERPELIEPGKVYEYTIDLWSTSNMFKKGHRLRIDISSSNFPRFDRNQNTGDEFGKTARTQPATQTIHHTRKYPSHVTLPVIPR